ncbi:RNA-directed RNA polymerase, partial [Spissistilus festinus virus 1]
PSISGPSASPLVHSGTRTTCEPQSGLYVVYDVPWLEGGGRVSLPAGCASSISVAREVVLLLNYLSLGCRGRAVQDSFVSPYFTSVVIAPPVGDVYKPGYQSATVDDLTIGVPNFSASELKESEYPGFSAQCLQLLDKALSQLMARRLVTTTQRAAIMARVFPAYQDGSRPDVRQQMRESVARAWALPWTEAPGDPDWFTTGGWSYAREANSSVVLPTALAALALQSKELAKVMPNLEAQQKRTFQGSRLAGKLALLDDISALLLAAPRDTDVAQDDTGADAPAGLRAITSQWLASAVLYLAGACTGDAAPPLPSLTRAWLVQRNPALLAQVDHLDGSSSPRPYVGIGRDSLIRFPGLTLSRQTHHLHWAERQRVCPALVVRIRSVTARRHLKALNRLFPSTSLTDSKHQTTHLAEVVWSYVVGRDLPGSGHPHGDGQNASKSCSPGGGGKWFKDATASQRLRAVNAILNHIPVGTGQLLTTGAIIAGLGLQHCDLFRDTYLKSGCFWRLPHQIGGVVKAVGTYIRKCAAGLQGNPLSLDQVTQLAYYDLLTGRSKNVTNWQEEIANRCTHTYHIRRPCLAWQVNDKGDLRATWVEDSDNLNPRLMKRDGHFYSRLRSILMRVCEPLVTARNTREPLDKFYARRHEWIASGSSAGARAKISIRKGRLGRGSHLMAEEVKVSKRAWAEATPLSSVLEALALSQPREVAHASEKYENGKARAIYGVEPMHYVINTYATKGFEERLHLLPGLEKGASGSQACALEVRRALITRDPDLECTMLDYADFNRHHTPEAQSLLFDVFARLGKTKGAHPDWVAANLWVARAKKQLWALFPGETEPRKVRQGMFSGTRSTDLINTLLNLAYFEMAKEWLEVQCGLAPTQLYHVHQGDDVWVSNGNPLWARALYYCLNNMGFIFQGSKQMFGPGRGEYLRVLYSGGRARGYFARSLANYLLRPIQNASSADPLSWARNISDGTSLLARRGLTPRMALALYMDAARFWVRARAHPKDNAPVSIPLPVCWLPGIQGGLGSPPPTCLWLPELDQQLGLALPVMRSSINVENFTAPTLMTDDWIAHVSKQAYRLTRHPEMPSPNLKMAGLRDDIIMANYVNDLAEYLPERGWAQYKRDWAELRTSVGKRLASMSSGAIIASRTEELGQQLTSIQAWIGYGHPPSHIPAYPYLRSHVDGLDLGEVGFDTPLENLRDKLSSIITRSVFKNENTLARVTGLTRLDAISLILAEADVSGFGDADVAGVLGPLLTSKNAQMVDLLLGSLGDLVPGLRAYVNNAYWQHVQSVWIAQLTPMAITHPGITPLQCVSADKRGTAQWLYQTIAASQVATSVVY